MKDVKDINEYMAQARIDFSKRKISAEQLSSMEAIALVMIDNLNIQSYRTELHQDPNAPVPLSLKHLFEDY